MHQSVARKVLLLHLLAGCLLSLTGNLLLAVPVVNARSLEEIQRTGSLRICVAGSSALLYQANGEAFARFLNVTPEVRRLKSFDEQFENDEGRVVQEARYESRLLADGSCDLFPNDLHVADWRESKMLLVPYYTVRKVIVARRELLPVLKQLADLAGRKAAVQAGTAYDTWLGQINRDQFPGNPIVVIHAPTEDSVRSVAEGSVDFTVLGTDGAFKWVRSDIAHLTILFPVDKPVQVGWGLALSARSLAEELKRFFEESKRIDSDIDRNWRQYYQVSLMEYEVFQSSFMSGGIDLKTFLAWSAPVSAILLAAIATMLYWNLRVSIKRRLAVEGLRKSLEATVGAIAATVESRDPYTAGHQRRVADVVAAIATEMGLQHDVIEGLKFGAAIHDLGKVRVPAELLAKPTHLKQSELAMIRLHAQIGYDIVKSIDFPWPVALMIRQHHERLDGTGYPLGLKGEQISIESRILAVADVVEAMASDRPYREGLGIEASLKEIEEHKGTWYDEKVVDACLRIFREKGFILPL
jgi:HD-GYP domain-containing protein (c-di-GMP phosphodiesterase class II)